MMKMTGDCHIIAIKDQNKSQPIQWMTLLLQLMSSLKEREADQRADNCHPVPIISLKIIHIILNIIHISKQVSNFA